jgi:hypothetical protein
MNTFNISVNGKDIVTEISSEKLEGTLNLIRGLVWTSGGSDKDIEIKENSLKDYPI